MNRVTRFTTIVLVSLGCIVLILFEAMQPVSTMPKSSIEAPSSINAAQNVNFERHFQELGVEGSILIDELNSDRVFQHNLQRNTTAFLPASTFKILNSLISLETKVISDEIAILTWDGTSRMLPGIET